MSTWIDEGSSGAPVDVAAIMDSGVADVCWELVQLGLLVSFGTTSDGGALNVQVTSDGKWRRQYARTSEDLVEFLSGALEFAKGAASTASSASRPRRRRAG